MPKPSLPMRLALLIAGTMLPLILFATGLVVYNYEQDRQEASQRILETVRSIRLVLDAGDSAHDRWPSGAGAHRRSARR